MELVSANVPFAKIVDCRNMEPLDVFTPCKGSRILSMKLIDSTIVFLHSTEDKIQFSTLTIEVEHFVRLRGGG